ncbi:MAG: helix-turn-helix domain-containing protein [Chloroflexota bacterium]|nr:helix-turn-helix domain-containing protein [Chloroflexota bacterium]
MAFFVRPLTSHEEKIIHDLAEHYQSDAVVLKRLKIILLSNQRMKSGEIARQLQITPSTIVHWIKRFNRAGLGCFEQSFSRGSDTSVSVVPDSEPLFARVLSSSESDALQQLMTLYQGRSHTLKRLQAIILSSQGSSVSEIARTLSLSQKTVRLWIKLFNNHGVYRLETFGDRSWLGKRSSALV